MALGGYGSAILTTNYGLPPIVGVLAGVGMSTVFGYALGRIILRLKHWYLAIATLSVAVITDTVLEGWLQVTGGPNGILGVPPFSLGGLVFDTTRSFYILAWIVALAGVVFAIHLGSSRVGRAYTGISGDEVAASTLGIDVVKYKVQSLTILAVYAGLSGALYVHFLGLATPSSFSIMISFEVMMAVILGGIGTIYGAFLAAPLLKFLPDMTAAAGDFKLIIYGLIFILVPMYFAGGISGILTAIWFKLAKLLPIKSRSAH